MAPAFQFTNESGLGQQIDLGISVGLDGKLWCIDLSDPYNSQLLGSAVDEQGATAFVTARDLVISPMAGLVYVTTLNAIQVFDIRNPYQPKRLANITALPGPDGEMRPVGSLPALIEQNGWLFMADQGQGMRVLDLDPVSIHLIDNRVVILDKDGKALKTTINYTIQSLDKNFGHAVVEIYQVVKDAGGQPTGETLYRSYATGRKNSGSADIAKETFPLDQTFYAQVIVNKGITGKETKSVKIPFIQQAIMVPDYDHNRKIDDTDRMLARTGDTFYFWINDDDDQGETSGTDIPGSKMAWTETTSSGISNGKIYNYENHVVDGVRDLVDFFPVQLDLAKLLDVFPASQFTYKLTTGGEHLNLVFTKFGPDQAGNYLTGVPTQGAQNDLTEAKILGHVSTLPIAAEGSKLFDLTGGMEFLQRLKTDGKNIVLFEGRSLLNGPLTLEIGDGSDFPLKFDLNLSIAPVEQMFRHKNLIGQEAGYQPVSGSQWGEPDRLMEPQNCPDDICLNSDGTDFVFVHGYNVDGQQARGWQSEMFKRMFRAGSKSRFGGADWY
ncbi:MAG: hypothetical protein L3J63_06435, partial [Geopsychrobacter sp.]|nr:hypothetical protein [Geopsychrobacter sp.]